MIIMNGGRLMKNYIFKFKGLFFLTTILIAANAAINVFMAFMLKYIIDLATGNSLSNFLNGVLYFCAYIGAAFLIEICLKTSKASYIKKTLVFLKNDVFSSVLKKDMKSFGQENSAKFISVLTNDINMIEQDYILNIFNLVNYAVAFILAFASVLSINIVMTIIIFAVGLATFTVPQLFGKKLSEKKAEYSSEMEVLTAKTKDLLSGFEVIRNFNIYDKAKQVYERSNTNTEIKKQKFSVFSGIVDSIAELMGTLMFIVPIVFGGYFVMKGSMTVGTLIALIQLMNNLANPLANSIQIINKIKSLKSISEKIQGIIKADNIEEEEELFKLPHFNKTIEFKNVSFSYDGSKNAIENIDLAFEKGKKYALVGASGSGKSTILKLLLRYYDSYKGGIMLDGLDLQKINIDDVYKNLSVIQQNVFMFDGTIKDNIGLYGDYSNEQILKAAEEAGLTKLVESLNSGIDEEIGENGGRLSGGEKQRIAIARALIKKSSILLLDEGTSALDNETAYNIEKSILSLKDITSIVVTHKLMGEVLKKYDEIIVVKDGKVIEKGSFNELLAHKAYFYSLYTLNEQESYETEASIAG